MKKTGRWNGKPGIVCIFAPVLFCRCRKRRTAQRQPVPGDLYDAAGEILDSLEGRTIVALRGEMGAGKTTLIREICDRLGVADTVTSPTFAIINEYKDRGHRPVYHFDFYRINRIEEAFDFGYEEYFYSGNLCLVEWPEKIEQLMPAEGVMTVLIDVTGDDSRVLRID